MDLNRELERLKSEDASLVRDSGETERSLSLSLISGPEMFQRFSRHNQQLFTSSLHSAFHPPRFSAFNLVGTFPATARSDIPTDSSEGPGSLYSSEYAEAETNKRKSSVKNSGSCKKTREKSSVKQTTPDETGGL